MGVPIADQAIELSATSRRLTYLPGQGRPSDFDIEERPMFATKAFHVDAASEPQGRDPLDSISKPRSPHYSHRAPWLRALVLGANDGLVSITSLMLGVDAAVMGSNEGGRATVISGVAGLIAGACSMAIGEFVSVFSQRDSELADLEIERQEHLRNPDVELEELTQIYVGRGLSYYLAKQVAEEFTQMDALKAHARDELGIDLNELSNPTQAALASALAFASGGAVPLLAGSFLSSSLHRLLSIVAAASLALAVFGALGARLGGANMGKAAVRVLAGGWLAMSITYGVLRIIKLVHDL